MNWANLLLMAALLGACDLETQAQTEPKVYVFEPGTVPTPAPIVKPAPRSTPAPVIKHTAQVDQWLGAKTNPKSSIALDVAVKLFERNRSKYQAVQAMKPNGVPDVILFTLHYRESDNDFKCSLAQGDPLTHRSTHVPKGRIPDQPPPYSWQVCAFDAVYVVDHLDGDWTNPAVSIPKLISYNGTGYARHGIPSPYFYNGLLDQAGTPIYLRGKFVSDGRFDAHAVDRQMGCGAILKRMADRGIPVPF